MKVRELRYYSGQLFCVFASLSLVVNLLRNLQEKEHRFRFSSPSAKAIGFIVRRSMESNLKSRRSWSFWVSCMHVQIWCSHLNAIFRLPTQFFAHQSGQRSYFRESRRWSHKLPHSTVWFQLGNAIRSLPHFDRLSQVTQYSAVVLFRNKNHEKVNCSLKRLRHLPPKLSFDLRCSWH